MKCRRLRANENLAGISSASARATFVVERGSELLGACAVHLAAGEGRLTFAESSLGNHGVRRLLLERCESEAVRAGTAGVSVVIPTSDAELCREIQARGYFPRRTRQDGGLELRRQLAPLEDTGLAYRHFDHVPWHDWPGVNPATLLFVVAGGHVLLIHKKRGHGAGLVNGPGGKLEAGETPIQCAVREVEEETGIHPIGARLVGELHFQYASGDSVYGYAFRAGAYSGALVETDEATPFWVPLAEIPYDEMWDDDRVWLPLLLESRPFIGRFLVHDDRLFQYEVVPRA